MAFLIDTDSSILIDIIKQLNEKNQDNGVKLEEVYRLGKENGLEESFIKSELLKLRNKGNIYSSRPGYKKEDS